MLVNLQEVLSAAQKGNYAVGLFNTTDTDMLQAVIDAAEEMRAPVIVGTAEVLLPYGELKLIAPAVVAAAKRAKVPVVVHYDHGLTFERCMEALKLGFTSVMFDGSTKPYEENIAETREVVRIAHAFGATVEGEIGHVGQAASGDNLAEDMYTTVDEALAYYGATGVEALAVSFGTAHGVYKSKPKLNLTRLGEIHKAVSVPLVLHGGSGLSEEDFKNSIRNGVAKVNIFTDLELAGVRAMQEGLQAGQDYLEIRNKKVEYIRKAVEEKIAIFGSANKA